MPLPLESVPNVSEGRDEAVLRDLRAAMSAPARLLDVHTDWDHHRSVFTLVGSGEELVEALLGGIRCASERIDLRRHEGAHRRRPARAARARGGARRARRRARSRRPRGR
jgi:glutamate formiminotransferase / 5-formyltetrahydrofolate cyclo-ligase